MLHSVVLSTVTASQQHTATVWSLAAIIGLWMVFKKAGIAGWASIIPIFNIIMLLGMLGRPWWWLLLLLVPGVNIVIALILCVDVAMVFGKSVAFGIGIAACPGLFLMILGFGAAQYKGPRAAAIVNA